MLERWRYLAYASRTWWGVGKGCENVSQPYACPICGRLTIRKLFDTVRITAEIDHEFRNVGGLAAFMCTENSHIFFVMKKDLDTTAGRAATGT